MRGQTWLAVGAVAASMFSLPALAERSDMCDASGDRFVLDFDIRPSLVVNSDAVLETTRGDLGLAGDAAERAFSFKRTISGILGSSGGPSDQAAQEAFVQTMIDSFQVPTGRALNAAAGISMPFDDRTEASELIASEMLDDTSSVAMKPLALFNRFDLSPNDWSHCGEHRIVYGRERQNPASPLDRFLLIFEGMVPNPDPSAGAAGCRRVAEFWAGLSGQSEPDQARALSEFFYEGKTGHAEGDLLDPVVHFRHYGGDGGRGQVRANAFMDNQPLWQLREWLTQLTFAVSGPQLAFVPVTVKDNPLAELYQDDLASVPEIASGNIQSAVTNLHGQFIQALTSSIAPRLLSEGTQNHQTLATGLVDYDLGAAPPVSEETVLLNTIALGNDDKFNEHQSVSQGGEDVPGFPAATSAGVTALLDQVGAMPPNSVNAQSGATILNRARAGTCGGCHMTASRSAGGFFALPGVIVRENDDGTVVRWPDIHSSLFVHVDEVTRELSPALEDAFLPVRRYILGRYLCETLDAAPSAPPPPPTSSPYELRLASKNLPIEAVTERASYLDEVISGYLKADDDQEQVTSAETGDMLTSVRTLDTSERSALRVSVSEAISIAREIEQQKPGAFVATRRPH